MPDLKQTYCSQCKRLVYIAWVDGKRPANFDTGPVSVIELTRGNETFLLRDGNTIKGVRVRSGTHGAKTAYPQHKTSCEKALVYTGLRSVKPSVRQAIKEQVAKEKKEKAERAARQEVKAQAQSALREAEAAQLSFFGNREVLE